MPPRKLVADLLIAHQRVVDAQIMIYAWRSVVDIVGRANPGYQAAEKEAADAQKAWEEVLRSL